MARMARELNQPELDILDALDLIRRVRVKAEVQEISLVRRARSWGLPWTKIGEALDKDAATVAIKYKGMGIK